MIGPCTHHISLSPIVLTSCSDADLTVDLVLQLGADLKFAAAITSGKTADEYADWVRRFGWTSTNIIVSLP